MYNHGTIIRFGFCDIQNNQSLGKGYQTKLKSLTFTILLIAGTSSNDCFLRSSAIGLNTSRDRDSKGTVFLDLRAQKTDNVRGQ